MGIFFLFGGLAIVASLSSGIRRFLVFVVSKAKIDVGIEVEPREIGNRFGLFIVRIAENSPFVDIARIHDQLVFVGSTQVVATTHREACRCARRVLRRPAGEMVEVKLRRPGMGEMPHRVVWGPKLRDQESLAA